MEPLSAPGPLNYFWLVAIVVTIVNAGTVWLRVRRLDPALRDGYREALRGYVTWLNLPWIVMGAGSLMGTQLPQFFAPRLGNPYVLAFHATVLLLWLLGIRWIYFAGGADFLARHPLLINFPNPTPTAIKLLVAVCLLGGVAGETAMWLAF